VPSLGLPATSVEEIGLKINTFVNFDVRRTMIYKCMVEIGRPNLTGQQEGVIKNVSRANIDGKIFQLESNK
jgi:hypothetical protein